MNIKRKEYFHDYNEYLLRCDFINKYNSKTIFEFPVIKKVIFNFPLKEFDDVLKKSNLFEFTDTNDYSKILAFLFYFIYTNSFSYINLKEIKIDERKILSFKNRINEYSLKNIITKKCEINKFLVKFIIENYSNLDLKKPKNNEKKINKTKMNNNFLTKWKYDIKIPVENIFNIKEFYVKIVQNIELKDFYLTFSFLLKGYNKFKNVENYLKICTFF